MPVGWKSNLARLVTPWEEEHPAYVAFLDLEALQERKDDPNAFKGALHSQCPIIRRSLNSPAEETKKYKKDFSRGRGQDPRTKTINIVSFGEQYVQHFDDAAYENAEEVEELGLAELQKEGSVVYGVIGGGIRSHFLYMLHPRAFPNRSRKAVWALYFLSGQQDFGFHDGSEFLMINRKKSSTLQNYHYPYDLFAFYSLKVYGMLKEAYAELKTSLRNDRRYVYLDAFFNFIHDHHQRDINAIQTLDVFKVVKGKNAREFENLLSASKTGLLITTAKNTGRSAGEIVTCLYRLLAEGKSKTDKMPARCLLIESLAPDLPDDVLAQILADVNEKKKYRVERLEHFVKLLDDYEESTKLHQEIGLYLGVDKCKLNRIYQTLSNDWVRSKSEVIIANLLYDRVSP